MPRKRVLIIALVTFVAALWLASGRVQASTEFCPARVRAVMPVGNAFPSALYAVQLDGFSKRTAGGILAVQTERAWYLVPFRNVEMIARTRTFTTDTQAYQRTDYYADPLYMQLPHPEKVLRVWVSSARADSESVFGWTGRGDIACEPQPAEPYLKSSRSDRLVVTPPDPDLTAQPIVGTTITSAVATTPPQGLDCAKPFAYPHVLSAARPAYNDAYVASVSVRVALDSNGKLVDATIEAPSTVPALNRATVEAAKKTTFAPEIALCRPVPGNFLFTVNWNNEP